MRALVHHGPGNRAWQEAPDPEITDGGDVIVRVDAYDVFARAASTHALKVVLSRSMNLQR